MTRRDWWLGVRSIALAVVIAVTSLACGNGSSPTAPTQQIVQVGGVWSYGKTLTAVTGGDCVGALLQSTIGTTERGSFQITQAGSSLNATATSDASGNSCTYAGTAGAASIALNGNVCTAGRITGISCTNGAVREIRIQAFSVNANVTGSTAAGTVAETWNVFTNTGAAAGIMTLNGVTIYLTDQTAGPRLGPP